MESKKMRKQLSSVDFAKLLFAIGVVAIHARCFAGNDLPSWLMMHGVLRLAVPFFFCSVVYFFYSTLRKSKDLGATTKKYIKRLIVPMVFWLTINLPIVVYGYISDGSGLLEIIAKLIRSLIFYPWGAMWFVLALIVATMIVVPFYRKGRLGWAVAIGAVFYLIGLVFNNYYFVVVDTPLKGVVDVILQFTESMRNGIFEGLFFVSAGMYVSKLQEERKYNRSANILVLVISYVLLLVEIIIIKDLPHVDDNSLFIMFMTAIPCLMLFLSDLPSLKMDTTPFRNYSTGIYFSHRFVLAIVMFLLKPYNSIIGFVITLSIVVTVLFFLYKKNNKMINLVTK